MKGLILFGHGDSQSMDELDAYYAQMHERANTGVSRIPDTLEHLSKSERNSSICSITRIQAKRIEYGLRQHHKQNIKVYTAFRHREPFVRTTAKQMIKDGITEVFICTLKPLETKRSNAFYERIIRRAFQRLLPDGSKLPITTISGWQHDPKFLKVIKDEIQYTYCTLPENVRSQTAVIFTADHLIGSIESQIDFDSQLRKLAKAVAHEAQIPDWTIGYLSGSESPQSRSVSDIDAIIKRVAHGYEGVLVCDLQSLSCNHEAGHNLKELCKRLGLKFSSVEKPNHSHDFTNAMSAVISKRLRKMDNKDTVLLRNEAVETFINRLAQHLR